jgi:hypothetical protein
VASRGGRSVNLRRTAEQFLTDRQQRSTRKPLAMRGARQVGKTFPVESWGARHFPSILALRDAPRPDRRSCSPGRESSASRTPASGGSPRTNTAANRVATARMLSRPHAPRLGRVTDAGRVGGVHEPDLRPSSMPSGADGAAPPIHGHPHPWTSPSMDIPIHGHPHPWTSPSVDIPVRGHPRPWTSPSMDIAVRGTPVSWGAALRRSRWAGTFPSRRGRGWACPKSGASRK